MARVLLTVPHAACANPHENICDHQALVCAQQLKGALARAGITDVTILPSATHRLANDDNRWTAVNPTASALQRQLAGWLAKPGRQKDSLLLDIHTFAAHPPFGTGDLVALKYPALDQVWPELCKKVYCLPAADGRNAITERAWLHGVPAVLLEFNSEGRTAEALAATAQSFVQDSLLPHLFNPPARGPPAQHVARGACLRLAIAVLLVLLVVCLFHKWCWPAAKPHPKTVEPQNLKSSRVSKDDPPESPQQWSHRPRPAPGLSFA